MHCDSRVWQPGGGGARAAVDELISIVQRIDPTWESGQSLPIDLKSDGQEGLTREARWRTLSSTTSYTYVAWSQTSFISTSACL